MINKDATYKTYEELALRFEEQILSRKELSINIALRNETLTEDELNFVI